MENKMNIYYDDEGDFLEITSGDISNAYFDNMGNGIFKIIDKETGEVKGLAIFSFKKRTKDLEELKLSLPFKFNILSWEFKMKEQKTYDIYYEEEADFLEVSFEEPAKNGTTEEVQEDAIAVASSTAFDKSTLVQVIDGHLAIPYVNCFSER